MKIKVQYIDQEHKATAFTFKNNKVTGIASWRTVTFTKPHREALDWVKLHVKQLEHVYGGKNA